MVSVDGDCGSAPGARTASEPVRSSKIAASGRPASGNISPAGWVAGGGDKAGAAGSMVGGGAVSGFDEQPAVRAANARSAAADLRKPALFTSIVNG
ncbi:hypothetical protein MHEL_57870 [Mycolicibacterium helvum]|uniref:Uncharacterized protein n=1 Tax=Mycolicibacterium helvum TaxID=1534349 RepID=A0A7I7TE87_9MYCO|nr:hypothetical protein MHEL_57870 [Mycolicibacterium helvum]